jgi:hypothetical protein
MPPPGVKTMSLMLTRSRYSSTYSQKVDAMADMAKASCTGSPFARAKT